MLCPASAGRALQGMPPGHPPGVYALLALLARHALRALLARAALLARPARRARHARRARLALPTRSTAWYGMSLLAAMVRAHWNRCVP